MQGLGWALGKKDSTEREKWKRFLFSSDGVAGRSEV